MLSHSSHCRVMVCDIAVSKRSKTDGNLLLTPHVNLPSFAICTVCSSTRLSVSPHPKASFVPYVPYHLSTVAPFIIRKSTSTAQYTMRLHQ
jgi:hypothetical protein